MLVIVRKYERNIIQVYNNMLIAAQINSAHIEVLFICVLVNNILCFDVF